MSCNFYTVLELLVFKVPQSGSTKKANGIRSIRKKRTDLYRSFRVSWVTAQIDKAYTKYIFIWQSFAKIYEKNIQISAPPPLPLFIFNKNRNLTPNLLTIYARYSKQNVLLFYCYVTYIHFYNIFFFAIVWIFVVFSTDDDIDLISKYICWNGSFLHNISSNLHIRWNSLLFLIQGNLQYQKYITWQHKFYTFCFFL